jgi:hypothetical protein
MGSYLPLYQPGVAPTLKAGAAITGGQVVEITGEHEVGPAGVDSTAWVGVAGFDAAAGDDVVVYAGGVQRPVASGAVAAGALLECGAAGTVATAATPAHGTVVGVALSAAADGESVDVAFVR